MKIFKGYQVRKRDDHGTTRWEAWYWQKINWLNRTEFQKLGDADSEQEAIKIINEHVAPHYDEVVDYDEKGHRIFSGL